MNTTHRPNSKCPGYDHEGYDRHVDCGNTVYEGTWNDVGEKVWQCCNCFTETPRKTYRRRTNRKIAFDAYLKLKEDWKATDEALRKLVENGTPSGCLLVHTSTFNYHLGHLSDYINKKKITSSDVSYYIEAAQGDLQKAKQFVAEKQQSLESKE